MINSKIRQVFLIMILLSGTATIAAPLKTDISKSVVTAVFKQMSVPVEARFMKFSALIDFDSAKPEAGRANVTIEIPSFDLGDPDYNHEVQKKEWFDGATFPRASFISSKIKAGAAGKLDIAGKLTIKGKSLDISFPLIVKKEGALLVFEGSMPIKRLYFGIGDGEWKDTSVVADEVIIKFRVLAGQ